MQVSRSWEQARQGPSSVSDTGNSASASAAAGPVPLVLLEVLDLMALLSFDL